MINELKLAERGIAVVGLGYVGLPIAVAFSRHIKTIGYDNNSDKIRLYKAGIDPTREVGDMGVRDSSVEFTDDPSMLSTVSVIIVAVPTPITKNRTPDLTPLISASKAVGTHLQPGSIVCYESTVYPGVTEEICIPILERESGLICGKDFKVGYSPERINPGDKHHRLDNIVKVVSGIDKETVDAISHIYSLVVKAGVYKAESIRVAEAAKVIENSQRDINIAFMNELSIIFNKMNIDTKAVLETAGTKWNFLKFTPGLVGGHCIGIDPYYLTYKAAQEGYHSEIILAGRRINDNMGKFIAQEFVKKMIQEGIQINGANVVVLGFTFKENCPDIRNTKVFDLIEELIDFGINVVVTDPYASKLEAKNYYDIELEDLETVTDAHAVIVAVQHKEYDDLTFEKIKSLYSDEHRNKYVLGDLKGIFNRIEAEAAGFSYWRL